MIDRRQIRPETKKFSKLIAGIAGAALAVLSVVGFTVAVHAEQPDIPKEVTDTYILTGETERCLRTSNMSHDVIDDWHIIFKVGREHYLSRLPHKCNRLAFEESFKYTNYTSKLCNTEIIQVINTSTGGLGTTVSSCGLGLFEKLEKKPTETE